jgi:predicted outer membrane protein
MRSSLWVLAAGLLLAACRTDGERGEAVPQERGGVPQGGKPAPTERAAIGPSAEETGATRLLAAIRTLAQEGVDAGKLAQQRASSQEVKDYATRAVAENQASLDQLADLIKAKKIELDASAIQSDPLLRAEKETAREGIERLRSLSGTAFDAAYMTAQRPRQALLAQLATEGPQVSKDADVGNVLRTMAQQGRDRMTKAHAILPKACGGERPGWGGAG